MSKKVQDKPVAGKRVYTISSADIAGYADFFEENGLEELIVEEKGTKVVFRRSVPMTAAPLAMPVPMAAPIAMPAPAAAQAAPAAQAVVASAPDAPPANVHAVKSPLNGTFYATSSPDSPAFVSVGSMVSPGMTLCIVEAMKIFNEIKAETSGKVSRILSKSGDVVEENQDLIWIEPA
jgi:acetyl-CoA carboxylase biotin carboxyl carrier protein